MVECKRAVWWSVPLGKEAENTSCLFWVEFFSLFSTMAWNGFNWRQLVDVHATLSRHLFVLLLVTFVLSIRVSCAQKLDKNNGIIVTNNGRVVRAGAQINLTCIFIHTTHIEWRIPEYLNYYKDVSGFQQRNRHFLLLESNGTFSSTDQQR